MAIFCMDDIQFANFTNFICMNICYKYLKSDRNIFMPNRLHYLQNRIFMDHKTVYSRHGTVAHLEAEAKYYHNIPSIRQ